MCAATAPSLDPGSLSGAGLADQLPADAYWHLVHTLRLTLPPPLSDSPEDLTRRDHAAIARIAALAPANAAEADVAAQFVAASEQWKECLRLAHAPDTTPEWAAKCRAQANSMMRQANSALRLLLRMQAARRTLEADHAARDRLAWTEHCALGQMAQALSARRTAGPPAAPVPAEPPAEQIAPAPPASEPQPTPEAAAEEYAIIYPERAALIRRMGRLPDDAPFAPPDDDVVQALIASCAPDVAARDRPVAESRAA